MSKLKTIYLWGLLLGLFVLGACDTEREQDEYLLGSEFVRFDSESANAIAETESSEVTIIRGSSNLASALTVNLEVSATYADGSDASATIDLSIDNNTLVIPAGDISASFMINTIDDDTNTGSRSVNISLISNDANLPIGFPGPDQLFSSFNLEIEDDDCPYDALSFGGEYTVTALYDDGSTESFPDLLEPLDGAPGVYESFNFWNITQRFSDEDGFNYQNAFIIFDSSTDLAIVNATSTFLGYEMTSFIDEDGTPTSYYANRAVWGALPEAIPSRKFFNCSKRFSSQFQTIAVGVDADGAFLVENPRIVTLNYVKND